MTTILKLVLLRTGMVNSNTQLYGTHYTWSAKSIALGILLATANVGWNSKMNMFLSADLWKHKV